MRYRPIVTLAGLAGGFILFAGCAGPAPSSTPTFTPPPTNTPDTAAQPDAINLPGDEGIHLAPVEWWYFNGHLEDSVGSRYSFHFVTFITVTSDGEIPQLMQLSLADHGSDTYLTDEQPALVNDLQTSRGGFAFDLAGWHMSGDGNDYQLAFHTSDYILDLAARSQKPAVTHQGQGLVDLGRAGKTFYYSRTRLDLSGTLLLNDVPSAVSGTAWMDHQWGDFSTQPIGWDWTSLQMDDGSELMISLVWDSSNRQPISGYGTYVPPGGDSARHVPGNDITFTPTGSWQSPGSAVEYPSGWILEVTSLDLAVSLVPIQKNAEFGDSVYVPIAYWEGAVAIMGTKDGTAIGGNGFVELVGYDQDQTEPSRP